MSQEIAGLPYDHRALNLVVSPESLPYWCRFVSTEIFNFNYLMLFKVYKYRIYIYKIIEQHDTNVYILKCISLSVPGDSPVSKVTFSAAFGSM